MEDNAILVKIFNFCAYQERCRQEVTRRLQQLGMEEENISSVLTRLENEGFLDESRFARSFAGGKFRVKKWGRVKIRAELRMRGIAASLIEAAIREEIPEENYRHTLRELIAQKEREWQKYPPAERKSRIYRYLSQKGYEGSVVQDEL